MRTVKTLAATACALLLSLFVLAAPAKAQQPHYSHALSNLRQARALLDQDTRPGFREDRDRAIDELEKAIREVKDAMHDEGRETRFTPPPATAGDPERPMRSALGLLDDAAREMTAGEAPVGLREMQERTIRHINEARRALAHALHRIEQRY